MSGCSKAGPLSVEPDGIFVYSQFPNNVPEGPATINLEALLKNAQTNAATRHCRVGDS